MWEIIIYCKGFILNGVFFCLGVFLFLKLIFLILLRLKYMEKELVVKFFLDNMLGIDMFFILSLNKLLGVVIFRNELV